MNAIEQLYRNSKLVTKDGYVKVRNGLWVKSGPYQEQEWYDTDKSILPTNKELNEIRLKFQELIQIQEACGLPSLQQILEDEYPWVWVSAEYNPNNPWLQRMSDGYLANPSETSSNWVIPVRRIS